VYRTSVLQEPAPELLVVGRSQRQLERGTGEPVAWVYLAAAATRSAGAERPLVSEITASSPVLPSGTKGASSSPWERIPVLRLSR